MSGRWASAWSKWQPDNIPITNGERPLNSCDRWVTNGAAAPGVSNANTNANTSSPSSATRCSGGWGWSATTDGRHILHRVRGLYSDVLEKGIYGETQLRAAAAAQLYRGAFTAQHGYLRVCGKNIRSARWAGVAVGGKRSRCSWSKSKSRSRSRSRACGVNQGSTCLLYSMWN